MSDPIQAAHVAIEAYVDLPENVRTWHTMADEVIAAYKRARVVCDECDGTNRNPSPLAAAHGPDEECTCGCPNPGPMLLGVDGPFHASASKVMWICRDSFIDGPAIPNSVRSVPPSRCLARPPHSGLVHLANCGWVAREQTVWGEA